jgi:N-acetylglucosaminyldiphosphoundecaprenol N-acetyl-beta-D-mannosaminyltransferase
MSAKVRLLDIDFDAVTRLEAVRRLGTWIEKPSDYCHYVVTPNVDHSIIFQQDGRMRQAYREASLVVVDGMPLVWLSRLVRKRLPERVNGYDLTVALLDSSCGRKKPLRVFLMGALPKVADRAAHLIEQRWSNVCVVGVYSPEMGFEPCSPKDHDIVRMINRAWSDVLIVGLSPPKQELWINAHHRDLRVPVALCVGATIDFLAGEKPRAPKWMCDSGLEWFYRLWQEPRRLWRRYLRDAWMLPRLALRELLGLKSPR